MHLFDMLGGFHDIPMTRKPKRRYISPLGRVYIAILAGWIVALMAAFVFPETSGAVIYYVVETVRTVLW